MILQKKIKCLFTILLLCTGFISTGKTIPDSTYVKENDFDFSISGLLYFNYFELSVQNINEKEISYIPNNPTKIGVDFSHKKLPFDVAFGFNISNKDDENHLRSKCLDLQLSKYGRMYVADLFIQHYKGLYIDDPKLSVSESDCRDLSVLQTHLAGQYVFNGSKFSYQAAFNQNEKQLKSAGSWLLGGGVYYFKINSDSSFVFKEKNNVRSYQIGINAGYAYNWVINNYWLASGSLSLGANLENKNIKTFFDKDLCVNPSVICRSSIFYNKKKWSLGMSFVTNSTFLRFKENSDITLGSGRVYIKYVQRFNVKK